MKLLLFGAMRFVTRSIAMTDITCLGTSSQVLSKESIPPYPRKGCLSVNFPPITQSIADATSFGEVSRWHIQEHTEVSISTH